MNLKKKIKRSNKKYITQTNKHIINTIHVFEFHENKMHSKLKKMTRISMLVDSGRDVPCRVKPATTARYNNTHKAQILN